MPITVTDLSKSYLLYDSPAQRLWSLLLPGGQRLGKRFEALKPLSFTVNAGEVVGIIGRNGSGKSTLLQSLAGTLTPTTGKAQVEGRIAALLELGAGFNPDFTGRENLFLNGAILGLSRQEMAEKEAEILQFANIGEFIDRPLSTYSSGMVVRLAFAVATAIEPQLLIVDEALSVGDEAFQRKCFRRIEEMRARGTAILFVSHASQTIVQLCDRVLWLDQGECLMQGEPKRVTEAYHAFLNAPEIQRESIKQQIRSGEKPVAEVDGSAQLQGGTEYPPNGARIDGPELLNTHGWPVSTLTQGEDYRLRYYIHCERDVRQLQCGTLFKNRTGVEVAAATVDLSELGYGSATPGDILTIDYAFTCHLNPGMFFLNCGVRGEVEGEECYLHRKIDALKLEVLTPRKRQGLTTGGLTDLDFAITVTPDKESAA